MLPKSWSPTPTADLVRMGGANDGGYLVSATAIKKATLLISMGLSDNWSFEEDYMARSGGRVICFDHTVTGGFWRWYAFSGLIKFRFRNSLRYLAYRRFFSSPNAEHRLLKIGYDEEGGVSLASVLDEVPDQAIFLKMDIEGAEYRVLGDILAQADRFTGLVIEFHDVDLHRQRITDFVEALRGFDVVELHPNNYGGVDANGDPLVIEITFTRKSLIPDAAVASRGAPALAAPCDPNRPEIKLAFEPAGAD